MRLHGGKVVLLAIERLAQRKLIMMTNITYAGSPSQMGDYKALTKEFMELKSNSVILNALIKMILR